MRFCNTETLFLNTGNEYGATCTRFSPTETRGLLLLAPFAGAASALHGAICGLWDHATLFLAGGLQVPAQDAEEITGVAQFGVEVGKFAFLVGDKFVVEYQPQHGVINFVGQLVQRPRVAVLHEVLDGLPLPEVRLRSRGNGDGWVHGTKEVVKWVLYISYFAHICSST